MTKVKITERGWPAHLCVAERCLFRRNTLLELGEERVVVSTVGAWDTTLEAETVLRGAVKVPSIYVKVGNKYFSQLRWDAFYETMVFKARKEGVIWEADTGQPLDYLDTHGEIGALGDLAANEMREAMVQRVAADMEAGTLKLGHDTPLEELADD